MSPVCPACKDFGGCPRCKGLGMHDGKRCLICRGSGTCPVCRRAAGNAPVASGLASPPAPSPAPQAAATTGAAEQRSVGEPGAESERAPAAESAEESASEAAQPVPAVATPAPAAPSATAAQRAERPSEVAPRRSEGPRQQWEYTIFQAPSGQPGSLNGQWQKEWEGRSLHEVLNLLGEQGWEVVTARWREADSLPERFLLKRRRG